MSSFLYMITTIMTRGIKTVAAVNFLAEKFPLEIFLEKPIEFFKNMFNTTGQWAVTKRVLKKSYMCIDQGAKSN